MRDIYICHTVYHAYISMLKAFGHEREFGLIIIDTVPKGEQLAAQIESTNIFNDVRFIDRKQIFGGKYNEYLKNYFLCKYNKRRIDRELRFIKSYSNVFVFNDYSEIGCYLENEGIPYHLLEDGLDVYKQFDVYESIGRGYVIKKLLYLITKIPYSVGMNKCCIDIEINDDKELKTRIKQPIIVVNRKELEKIISDEFREKTNNAFGVGEIKKIDSGILILTQILTELQVVSNEVEQYIYYEKVVEKYSANGRIYLKPHPRDEIDYSKLEDKYNVKLLKKEIPMEVYASLPHIHFNCIVTYSSTAANITGLADQIVRMDESINMEG